VFELAIANAQWRITARQRLNRAQVARFLAQTPPTPVVMEACGMAHRGAAAWPPCDARAAGVRAAVRPS
jgi:hypothetical protein